MQVTSAAVDNQVSELNEIRRFEYLRHELIELEKRVQRSTDDSQNEEVCLHNRNKQILYTSKSVKCFFTSVFNKQQLQTFCMLIILSPAIGPTVLPIYLLVHFFVYLIRTQMCMGGSLLIMFLHFDMEVTSIELQK